MTATVHTLPMAPLVTDRGYNERLLGRRVTHRHYGAQGRLSGDYRYDRGAFWLEVETDADGRFWWAVNSIEFLGPIPMPCPRGGRGSAA